MSNPEMIDDRTLVAQILGGDRAAFRMLIKQHERLVGHMVGKLVDRTEEREELCQDTFMKVYEKLGEFGFQSKLSTWIATIAWRHAINHLRRKRIPVAQIPEDGAFSEHFIDIENPGDILEDKDMTETILKLIALLPVRYKTVLMLYHLEHMSYPEIGEITGMPEGTVKSYLFRARHLLKEKVKSYLGEEEML